jgi:DNA polymerase I-like protein with 3'-5' exonuclease and polymerase domains
LPGTKVLLLLGQRALDTFAKERETLVDPSVTLNQQRGSPIVSSSGLVYVASYLPQDAVDMKADFEKKYNILYVEQSDEDENEDDSNAKTTKGATKRSNFRFWLEKDTQKAIRIVADGLVPYPESQVEIYPSEAEVIEALLSNKGGFLHFDIETDRERNMLCFGFRFNSGKVYVVPVYLFDYSLAYVQMFRILQALAVAIRDNTIVGHSIGCFDLFVLAHKYKIPWGEHAYDTMFSHKRVFPEAEKSLGHVISLYTDLPYHKNEGVFEPKNNVEQRQLWEYNAKDVLALEYVKQGIDREAARILATESVEEVNECIFPYLLITLQGVRYDKDKQIATLLDNDRRMTALLRIIKWFVGDNLLPTSSVQCAKYFHDRCRLPVIGRSKKTGKPSLSEKNLLKLGIKHEHPLIPLCINFRQLMKESGTVDFIPWKE